ncbi:hypothetical protein [Catellatospora tritici]|uniref:hypothetical protein n=1 Tax=Catellatospora tritici TaxID=2851566 RepID=UPI001C2D40DA|nr:hypothetical protein [Catellatospora tritici]MBV1855283.1 hypothetical protein [Catellatospora tritici]
MFEPADPRVRPAGYTAAGGSAPPTPPAPPPAAPERPAPVRPAREPVGRERFWAAGVVWLATYALLIVAVAAARDDSPEGMTASFSAILAFLAFLTALLLSTVTLVQLHLARQRRGFTAAAIVFGLLLLPFGYVLHGR